MATALPASPDRVLHLVTPQSHGKPLCGETSSDAAIGAYCEHLDEKGEWCREVFGKGGKAGTACQLCLSMHPSVLWEDPSHGGDSRTLHAVVAISPYPRNMRAEFKLTGFCVSEDYMVKPEPSVLGQHVESDGVALTLLTHVVPRPRKGKGQDAAPIPSDANSAPPAMPRHGRSTAKQTKEEPCR